ncbi:MAG TPA: toxic anion resistance protein [Candidatus Scatomorpha pullicola]|nr:toxic anion resistance protein [Candidatus Scatomorpha pullicola]
MDENKEFIPSLTLDPNATATQAAPDLTFEEPTAEAVAPAKQEIPPEKLEFERLSPAEQAAVRDFAGQIDVTNSEQILNYGSAAQKNIADFSGAALGKVRTKDMGEIGEELSNLVIQLQGLDFDESEKKGFLGFFKKQRQSIAALKAQYDQAEDNVDKITAELEKHEVTLMKDIAMMDKMYEKNQQYYKELTMYILAGKLKCKELRETELPKLQATARETGKAEDAQAANDFANMIGRFEKKLHDLELTRMVSIQMAPQIRMIQSNDSVMAEKIRSSIVNTIPLWKSQMVMALTLHHSQQAMEAQRNVNDVTNRLLQQNAEKLHQGSVEIAREAERGIVDIETLQKTNQELISTLEEVRQIQADGAAKRAEAEIELGRIEGELKQKLLELRG